MSVSQPAGRSPGIDPGAPVSRPEPTKVYSPATIILYVHPLVVIPLILVTENKHIVLFNVLYRMQSRSLPGLAGKNI